MGSSQRPPLAVWSPARAEWETDEASLLCGHSAAFSGTWPRSGMTRSGAAYELPTWVPATCDAARSSLPTPQANLGANGGSQPPQRRREGGHSVSLADVLEHPTSPPREPRTAHPRPRR